MKKRNKCLAGMAAVALGMLSASSVALAAGDTIKVGTFLAVTGPASFLGDPELKTLQMYILILLLLVHYAPSIFASLSPQYQQSPQYR